MSRRVFQPEEVFTEEPMLIPPLLRILRPSRPPTVTVRLLRSTLSLMTSPRPSRRPLESCRRPSFIPEGYLQASSFLPNASHPVLEPKVTPDTGIVDNAKSALSVNVFDIIVVFSSSWFFAH